MLGKYCEKQGWEVVAVYQDDGYTGAIAFQKTEYRFKIGTLGNKRPEDWIEYNTLTSLVLNKIRECAAARQKAELFQLFGD